MDVKLSILILLNMAPFQKLVLAPGAIIRGNTVYVNSNHRQKGTNTCIEVREMYSTISASSRNLKITVKL